MMESSRKVVVRGRGAVSTRLQSILASACAQRLGRGNQKFTLEHRDFVALDSLGMGPYTSSIHIPCSYVFPFHTFLGLACDPTRTADVAAIVMQEGILLYYCKCQSLCISLCCL